MLAKAINFKCSLLIELQKIKEQSWIQQTIHRRSPLGAIQGSTRALQTSSLCTLSHEGRYQDCNAHYHAREQSCL